MISTISSPEFKGSLELLLLRLSQGRFGDLDRYIKTASAAADRAASLT